MTVFNGEGFLKPALHSLLAQTLETFEIVIIENGSTDDTPNILASFDDARLKVFPVDHVSRTEALNIALSKASGDYIAVQDADDISFPTRLETQLSWLETHPDYVLVASQCEKINQNNVVLKQGSGQKDNAEILDDFTFSNPITHSSVMYKAGAAQSVGGYPRDYMYAQDFALYIKLASLGKLMLLPERLVQLRLHEQSASNSQLYSLPRLFDSLSLFQEARKRPHISQDVQDKSDQILLDYRIRIATTQYHQKHYWVAFPSLLKVCLLHPIFLARHADFKHLVRGKISFLLKIFQK